MIEPFHLLAINLEGWPQSTLDHPLLRRLFSEFRFVPMAVACQVLRTEHLEVGLDLGKPPVAYGPQPAEDSAC
jgi:hypothetical protein